MGDVAWLLPPARTCTLSVMRVICVWSSCPCSATPAVATWAAALAPFLGVAVRSQAVVVEDRTAATLAAYRGPWPRLAQGEPELALRAGRQQRRLEVEQHVSRLRLALEAVSRELERDQPYEELVAAARPRLGRWVEPRLRGLEL